MHSATISVTSERDVVVHLVERAAALLALLRPAPATSAGRGRLSRHRLRAAARTRAEHLHLVAADLGAVAVLAGFLVLVLARAQAALDIDLRALLEILARDLGEPAKERDAVPLGGLFHLAARLVLPLLGGGDAYAGDRVPARQIA